MTELIDQGDTEKADEIKNDLAWKKAFDKTEGKKVFNKKKNTQFNVNININS